jgi:hypothetical protein
VRSWQPRLVPFGTWGPSGLTAEAQALDTTAYSALGDFSATNNPNGAWSYGYREWSGGNWQPFTPYTNHTTPYAGVDRWSTPQAPEPMVAHNNTGGTISYATIRQPPDMLNLHPGPASQSVVLWTAPFSGKVTVEGRFQGIDTNGTSTRVYVSHKLFGFTNYVNGYNVIVPFFFEGSVAAGNTIAFGVDPNANYSNDSTGLAATITLNVHVPTQCVNPQCTQSANSSYSRCKRRCESLTDSSQRKRCLRRCTSAFATKILNCGCLVVDYDSTTQIGTPRPCDAECSATVLSSEAMKDADYATLRNYLAAEGFVIDGTAKDFIAQEDGVTKASDLMTAYTHPSRSGTIAVLHYLVLATGESVAFVVISENGTVSKVLPGSILEQLTGPYGVDSSPSTSAPSARSAEISGLAAIEPTKRCDSQEAVTCISDKTVTAEKAVSLVAFGAALGGAIGYGEAASEPKPPKPAEPILKVFPKTLKNPLVQTSIAVLTGLWKASNDLTEQVQADCVPLGACETNQTCVDGQCLWSCRYADHPYLYCPDNLFCCKSATAGNLDGTCVVPECIFGKEFDPNTCGCKCQNSCKAPGVLDKSTCKCDCSAMTCNQPKIPNNDCSDCICPSGRETCGNTCCPVGQSCCNGACVDLNTNQQHCGACNNPCKSGQNCSASTGDCTPYTQICQNGQCQCPSGRYSCAQSNIDWCARNEYPVCCHAPYYPYACPAGSYCCQGNRCCFSPGENCGCGEV